MGLVNAAVWLGGAVFFVVAARPAMFSPEMKAVLQETRHFPYFAGAMAGVVSARCLHFHVVCAAVALFHLLAEWIYLGRPARKVSLGLLSGLLALALLAGMGIEPRLKTLHAQRHLHAQAAERERAARSFEKWHIAVHLVYLVLIGGLSFTSGASRIRPARRGLSAR